MSRDVTPYLVHVKRLLPRIELLDKVSKCGGGGNRERLEERDKGTALAPLHQAIDHAVAAGQRCVAFSWLDPALPETSTATAEHCSP